jgi:membrane protease YdiL (CAAX protease family)
MELADHLAATLVFLLTGVYSVVDARRFRNRIARLRDARDDARIRIYWELILRLWVSSAVVFALWLYRDYDFGALGFRYAGTWRFWLACAAVLLVTAYHGLLYVHFERKDETREELRAEWQGDDLVRLAPRTGRELRHWAVHAVSASSEVVVFCGFALWYLAGVSHMLVACLVATTLFAVAHSYQGVTEMVRAGVVGGVFLAMYLLSGSLWPAMALHVVQTFFAGAFGHQSLRPAPSAAGATEAA